MKAWSYLEQYLKDAKWKYVDHPKKNKYRLWLQPREDAKIIAMTTIEAVNSQIYRDLYSDDD